MAGTCGMHMFCSFKKLTSSFMLAIGNQLMLKPLLRIDKIPAESIKHIVPSTVKLKQPLSIQNIILMTACVANDLIWLYIKPT